MTSLDTLHSALNSLQVSAYSEVYMPGEIRRVINAAYAVDAEFSNYVKEKNKLESPKECANDK